jgi:hypothetical protein
MASIDTFTMRVSATKRKRGGGNKDRRKKQSKDFLHAADLFNLTFTEQIKLFLEENKLF